MKFIWGILAHDDCMSGSEANMFTLNDIDLIYDSEENKYILGVESIYYFKHKDHEIKYLNNLLGKFTQYMVDNGLSTKSTFSLSDVFAMGYNINTHFDTIEDCYTMFKLLVNGYSSLN